MGYVDMVEKGVVGGGKGSKTRGGTMFETFIPEPQAETAACRFPLLPPPTGVLTRATRLAVPGGFGGSFHVERASRPCRVLVDPGKV